MQKGLEDLSEFSAYRLHHPNEVSNYEIRCDQVEGLDDPNEFYLRVRNSVDAIIRDSKKRGEFDNINVILKGEYAEMFKETLEDILDDSKYEEGVERFLKFEPETPVKSKDKSIFPLYAGFLGGLGAGIYTRDPMISIFGGILGYLISDVVCKVSRYCYTSHKNKVAEISPSFDDYDVFIENVSIDS
ncbi:hypothetical protein GOV12_03620 [Candidatus Pacearchaeota archaeon]|nr:hypothetical protein [Candidatus Pacearchaeota archaeon]